MGHTAPSWEGPHERAAEAGPLRRHLLLLARPECLLILLFVISRLTLVRLGVGIDRLPVGGAWQLIDPPLLERSLFESLFHLHSQPPLYNLLVGLLLRIEDPAAAARTMDLLYALT